MSIEPLSALSRQETGPQSITRAIRQAANQSGLDFDLMLGVAKRESSLQADAKASASSASGLFQFIDQTWLGAVKEHGEELGLSSFAKDIERGEKGFSVTDPARKQEILDLRFDPKVAAKVAGKTLAAAKDRLSAALGREASGAEVYMAHFLGERGAVRMLNAGENALAAEVDPRAAKANQPLFFKGGQAVTVGEFRDKIAASLGEAPAATLAARPAYRGPVIAQPTTPVGPVPMRPQSTEFVPAAPSPSITPAPARSSVVQEAYAVANRSAPLGLSSVVPPQLIAAILELENAAFEADAADNGQYDEAYEDEA